VADGGGLENRCPVLNGTVGSNPTPSAIVFLRIRCGEMAELVEGARLLSECTLKRCTEGSNPSLSANEVNSIADCISSSRFDLQQQQHILLLRRMGTSLIILLKRPIIPCVFCLQLVKGSKRKRGAPDI
jgi:hypothetical protein